MTKWVVVATIWARDNDDSNRTVAVGVERSGVRGSGQHRVFLS